MIKNFLKVSIFLSAILTSKSAYAKVDMQSLDSNIPVASFIVKEVGSSSFLMAKNKDAKVAPASLTKIMTSIIAIESGRLDEPVTITKEATMVEPTKAGFKAGDQISLGDLVKAAMINSSNDAATAIAIHLGGSVERFAEMMNIKALAIGMNNTHFTNPAGFDKGEHYSTANDLLRLTEYAIKNPFFNEVAKMEAVHINVLNRNSIFYLTTHNKLLDKYKYSVGIKTGFTNKAGRCLIARAQKNDKDVLVVMLRAKTDRWVTAENLFEKAFTMNQPEEEIIEEASTRNKLATVAAESGEKISTKHKNSSKTLAKSGKNSVKSARASKHPVKMSSKERMMHNKKGKIAKKQ